MVEIIQGVHQVDGVNANSYLVLEKDGSLTLIDTGTSTSGKKILDYIKTNISKQPSDVKTIVLTHSHIDHVRGALAIKKATGAKVAIHEQDADYLSGKKKPLLPKGAMGFLFRIVSVFFRSPTFEPDTRLKENDKIQDLVVLHAPGHTPGSICLYNKERRLIFVGDAITNRGGKISGSPKMSNSDLQEANRSIGKISTFDFDVLLSGHGDPIKSGGTQKVKELSSSLKN